MKRVLIGFCVALLLVIGSRAQNGVAGAEGVAELPTDVTPLLSIAGIWQPIADQNVTPQNNGVIANTYPGNIRLPNGREGLVVTGWSFSGFSNVATSITPVNIAILEQQPTGLLQLATSTYVSDTETNGGANVIVADFNHDGTQDFFLPAHNESPLLPASSTAYLSNGATYTKVGIGDQVEAHGANLADINGVPTVFTASYYVAPGHADTASYFNGTNGFTVIPDTLTGGNSSVAVADFYGNGTYSAVYGDFSYGPNVPFSPANRKDVWLYHLSGLLPSGTPLKVGTGYFDDKPQYAGYPSFMDPIKTHKYRLWVDDFNHDGKLDFVVQGMIWTASLGVQKSILQMFQNNGSYSFTDVTDTFNPQYDQDCNASEYVPQVRDIDGSGIASYLFASTSYSSSQPACNYMLVNDGTGNLHVALYETLNTYGRQINTWLAANPSLSAYSINSTEAPKLRAYQMANGLLNFVAIVDAATTLPNGTFVHRFIFVNVPLQFDAVESVRLPVTTRST